MPTCSVVWRSSGGRGEFEYVPADSLFEREVLLEFEALQVKMPAEVLGLRAEGKPRLRKLEPNNRNKLHLPQLVMAVCRLPEPARQDITHAATFPLQNRSFVMDAMDFDIIDDDGTTATIAPLRVSILHADYQIDLQDRLDAIAADLSNLPAIATEYPELAESIAAHADIVKQGVNTRDLRLAADRFIEVSTTLFGPSNAGSATGLIEFANLPESEAEEVITGKEGRILTRIHSYKERDRSLVKKSKKWFKKQQGHLYCEVCEMNPVTVYGAAGERCIEAHHKIPVQELQPDSITRVEDMAMVCASCHRIIHSSNPCLSIADARGLLSS